MAESSSTSSSSQPANNAMNAYLSTICGIHGMSNVSIVSDNAKLESPSSRRRVSCDDLLVLPRPLSADDLTRASTDGCLISRKSTSRKAISKWDNGSCVNDATTLLSPEVFFRKTIRRSRSNSIDQSSNESKKAISSFSFDPRWESEASASSSSKLSARMKPQERRTTPPSPIHRIVRAKCAWRRSTFYIIFPGKEDKQRSLYGYGGGGPILAFCIASLNFKAFQSKRWWFSTLWQLATKETQYRIDCNLVLKRPPPHTNYQKEKTTRRGFSRSMRGEAFLHSSSWTTILF